jgi:hypothetical protein
MYPRYNSSIHYDEVTYGDSQSQHQHILQNNQEDEKVETSREFSFKSLISFKNLRNSSAKADQNDVSYSDTHCSKDL